MDSDQTPCVYARTTLFSTCSRDNSITIIVIFFVLPVLALRCSHKTPPVVRSSSFMQWRRIRGDRDFPQVFEANTNERSCGLKDTETLLGRLQRARASPQHTESCRQTYALRTLTLLDSLLLLRYQVEVFSLEMRLADPAKEVDCFGWPDFLSRFIPPLCQACDRHRYACT